MEVSGEHHQKWSIFHCHVWLLEGTWYSRGDDRVIATPCTSWKPWSQLVWTMKWDAVGCTIDQVVQDFFYPRYLAPHRFMVIWLLLLLAIRGCYSNGHGCCRMWKNQCHNLPIHPISLGYTQSIKNGPVLYIMMPHHVQQCKWRTMQISSDISKQKSHSGHILLHGIINISIIGHVYRLWYHDLTSSCNTNHLGKKLQPVTNVN